MRALTRGLCAMVAVGLIGGTSWAAPAKLASDVLLTKIPKLTMEGIPLDRALAMYGEMAGANIVADWDALKRADVRPDSKVNAKGADLTFAKVLDLTSANVQGAKAPLSWYIDVNTFHFTTQAAILNKERLRTFMQLAGSGGSSLALLGGNSGAAARARESNGLTVARPGAMPALAFEQTPLVDVMEFFRTVSGMNMVVNWKALSAVGVEATMPISLQVKNVSVWKAMDLVLDQVNAGKDRYSSVYWVLDDGVVSVTTGGVLDQEMRVKIYDVADLLMVIPDYDLNNANNGTSTSNGNTANTNNSGGSSSSSGMFGATSNNNNNHSSTDNNQLGEADQRARMQDNMIAMIKSAGGDDLWAPTGRGTVRILNGKMIISQSQLGWKLLDRAMSFSR